MQQAILITAYKNLSQLHMIADIFSDYSNYHIYIHIDRKSKIQDNDIEELLRRKNIKLVSRRYKVNWGGFNHLKAILHLAEEALKNSNIAYMHAISGQDIPVKAPDFITDFLNNNSGKEFIDHVELPYESWQGGGMNRILNYNLYDTLNASSKWQRKIIKFISFVQEKANIHRKLPENFPKIYGGGTWWTLSSASIQYVLNYVRLNPTFMKAFDYSFCAEEIVFQTIIMNSHFKDNVVNDDLRYIVWSERNGSNPANLDDTDFEKILASDNLFARKFDSSASINVLNKLYQSIVESN